MKILGIHSGHGCGVALLNDGACIYAASEERFARKKIIYGYPHLAVDDCLKYTGVEVSQIDRVALSIFNPVMKWKSLVHARTSRVRHAGLKSLLFFEYPNEDKPFYYAGLPALFLNLAALTGIPTLLGYFLPSVINIRRKFGSKIPIDFVGHHECHALGTAYFCGHKAPFSVVSEGYDGEASLKYDDYDDQLKPKRLSTTYMPHSPGEFYNCPTFILGFNFHKHCGKITGLAAYGDSNKLIDKVRALMWEENGEVKISPLITQMCVEYALTQKLPKYFEGEKQEDIAAAFQRVLEEVQVKSFEANIKKTEKKSLNIALSGGTFANVKLNQNFLDQPRVESIFVMPPMSDEGQPVGAAVASLQIHDRENWKPHRLPDAYLGPDYPDEQIEIAIKQNNLPYHRSNDVELEIAKLIHEGLVVARVNGRMEFGPRALGNRSILARPTDPAVNDWLNKRLKRTEFMPFAPSVIDTNLDKLFTGNYRKGLDAAEFMTITFQCTEWMTKNCPAVVHIDGTARPQIVRKATNPSFYKIISEYEKISGLPVVINTSFNMHEEPIVCTPEDSIRAFLQGHLDILAIGPFIVKQKGS